ncbi:MAG: DUF4260 domain-containing protein [Flavobacteriales bacterium]|nr:DUF4260 domain-containing protein [Flavobacteriales bacterium]
MKTLLKLEESAQFVFCAFVLLVMDVPWWVFTLLLIGPDVGMLGYLINTRVGALTYNIVHHKGMATLVGALGVLAGSISVHAAEMRDLDDVLYISGLILYGHASMDRIFGYGLKFGDNFHHTHLGWIGKGASKTEG